MNIIYENVDITDQVDVIKCNHTDRSGDKCDFTEIELENAAAWYRWGPQVNDKIRIEHNGYTTGNMYINTILPEDGRYRIFLTSVPTGKNNPAWRAYNDITLNDIMHICAAELGMKAGLFGADAAIRYNFLLRQYESAARFIWRLLRMEGATLKCYDGKILGIDLGFAQAQNPAASIVVSPDQSGVQYKRHGQGLKSLTIETPFALVRARDINAKSTKHEIYTGYPAGDEATAGRWARGLLMSINREFETLTVKTAFGRAYTALARLDITGMTDVTGSWLIDEAEHDLIAGSSKLRLVRCISGSII